MSRGLAAFGLALRASLPGERVKIRGAWEKVCPNCLGWQVCSGGENVGSPWVSACIARVPPRGPGTGQPSRPRAPLTAGPLCREQGASVPRSRGGRCFPGCPSLPSCLGRGDRRKRLFPGRIMQREIRSPQPLGSTGVAEGAVPGPWWALEFPSRPGLAGRRGGPCLWFP